MLGLVEDACDDGLDVTFDSYPYSYSSTRLLILIPQWAHNGGPERLKEVLRSPKGRERIRKMTSFPAQRLGLPHHGLLRDGFKANLVVFDAKRVQARAKRTQPKQFPIGIKYVVVNGKVVVDKGQHTGIMAGRAMRRGWASTS